MTAKHLNIKVAAYIFAGVINMLFKIILPKSLSL